MADVTDLANQIIGLFKESLQGVFATFTADDRQSLIDCGRSIAECAARRRASTDPEEQNQLDQQISGFSGAINLMVDRYMLTVSHEVEKAALQSLKVAAEWGLKIIVAAVAL